MNYNGWSNHSTWLVALWVGDCFYDEISENNYTTEQLAERIEEFVDELVLSCSPMHGLITDLLQSKINEVNFVEIAESLFN